MTAPALEHALLEGSRRAFLEAFTSGLRPEPRITVSEWADRNRVLGTRSSRVAGPWRTDRFPYLREVMDCLSTTSPVQTLVLQKGSQVGGTEVGNNWIGYVVDHAPGPMMAVLATDDTNTRKSRQTLDPLFEDTPSLASKVHAAKSRNPGNTTTLKVFPGGILVLVSARSASDLRSMPVRWLFLDEIDAYPDSIEGEGDPEALAERGTRTFRLTSKTFKVSTPTIRNRSRIEAAFRQTDRRYYNVPCPHCGELQRITWPRIRWEMGPDEDRLDVAALLEEGQREVWLECERCKRKIPESAKTAMLAAGVWIPEDPSRGERVRGYHLSALYSPFGFYPWASSVASHLKAKDNPERLRVWVNQDLGETWTETGDAPDWQVIYERREPFPSGIVPLGGRFLTAGVDVQGDRIEVEVMAWAPDLESWSVEYLVFPGEIGHDPAPFLELDRLLMRQWPHADGGEPLVLAGLGIDTGHATSTVYQWVHKFGRSARVFALKGRAGTSVMVGIPSPVEVHTAGKSIRRGVQVWPVDTGVIKEELYGFLGGRPPVFAGQRYPPGYCHFPQRGPEYFQQLTAETLKRVRTKTGRLTTEWTKTRERNEALDCRVYGRAVAHILGIDRLRPEDWDAVRRVLASRAPPEVPGITPDAPRAQQPPPEPPNRRDRSARWQRGRRRT